MRGLSAVVELDARRRKCDGTAHERKGTPDRSGVKSTGRSRPLNDITIRRVWSCCCAGDMYAFGGAGCETHAARFDGTAWDTLPSLPGDVVSGSCAVTNAGRVRRSLVAQELTLHSPCPLAGMLASLDRAPVYGNEGCLALQGDPTAGR